MSQTQVSRTIQAPPDRVFDTIAHIENFRKAVPDIIKVEHLSEQKRGKGTRFKETRRMDKREAATVLEVQDYVPNQRVRMVSDAGGTIWDSTFELTPEGSATRMVFTMDTKPYKLLAKFFVPMIKGMVKKAIIKDMDAVKAYCEGHGDSEAQTQ